MKKTYNPQDIEKSLYMHWEQNGYFKPNNDSRHGSYCIMMPPPNITGGLHMGHAFQQIITDILVRYQRMQGKNTLWQAGTDHAGIATQMIIERKILAEEGKTRHDYGRHAFIKKAWKWKEKLEKTLFYQMRRLGSSADWDRRRFTMDQGISNAVREVFVRLYQEDLIYRGKRLVNWDPKLGTAVSDLELENREFQGSLWYLCYPLTDGIYTTDGLNHLIVATTRPETLLGDVGVAVHPKDSRYHNLIGHFVTVPIINRRIPIIGDNHADMTKGTGCVKITPAHDFNDYEVGKRHALPMINVLTLDGCIRREAEVFDVNGNPATVFSTQIPKFLHGLERFSARKTIVAELDRLNLLACVKTHQCTMIHGDRSGAIIEPMLTDQWYMRTKYLAKAAMAAVKNKDIQFVPKQYENMYFSWMSSIQDWCISRQLWWGHRIPAWYDVKNKIYVGRNESEVRQNHQLTKETALRQDDDVLDTWFSSSLWTFSTLGWPKDTNALRTFHPTNVVVSGFDIIFFWIARMIMLTLYSVKRDGGKPQVPFNTVYITGLIRDEKGEKMSKSKGNVVDPLDIIDGISLDDLLKKRTNNMLQPHLTEEIKTRTKKCFPKGIKSYGTDALRLTLAALASTSRDINWDTNRLEGYSNFCNKLWNAGRFILTHTKQYESSLSQEKRILSLADRWIIAKFNSAVKHFRKAIDTYRFDLAARVLYDFTWNEFCNWYIELTKITIDTGNKLKLIGTYHTMVHVFEGLLRLAHPIIPFITETIWQKIKYLANKQGETIMLQPFPSYNTNLIDTQVLTELQWIKKVIVAIRTVRSEMHIPPRVPLTAFFFQAPSEIIKRAKESLSIILTLARLDRIEFICQKNKDLSSAIVRIIEGTELLISIKGSIDKNSELLRLEKEKARLENKVNRIEKRLSNVYFINRAPKSLVEREHEILKDCLKSIEKLLKQKELIDNL